MTVSGPILVAHLFPEISQHLVDLLRSLTYDENASANSQFPAKCEGYRQPSARRQSSALIDAT